LSDLHPCDVASVLANPEWAEFVVSDEELRAANEKMRARIESRRENPNRRGE